MSKMNSGFIACILLGLCAINAHAACEDISGIQLKLVKVTENDECFYTSLKPTIDPATQKVVDGNLTENDCKQIIPPDPQFYGVFFIENSSFGIANVCEVAKAN